MLFTQQLKEVIDTLVTVRETLLYRQISMASDYVYAEGKPSAGNNLTKETRG